MGLFGAIKRGADTFAAFRFLRLLTMKFTKMPAYKLGLIDAEGNKIRSPETSDEKGAYTLFHRLVFNIRRLMGKIPFGKSTIASYAAALYLIKEHTGLSENLLGECLFETLGFNPYNMGLDLMEEDQRLLPGEYVLKGNVYLNNGEELCLHNHHVSITEEIKPHSSIFGYPVFEIMSEEILKPILLTKQNLFTNETT